MRLSTEEFKKHLDRVCKSAEERVAKIPLSHRVILSKREAILLWKQRNPGKPVPPESEWNK